MKLLGGGFINKTIKILHNNNSDDGMILRINGTVGEQVVFFPSKCFKVKNASSKVRNMHEFAPGVKVLKAFKNHNNIRHNLHESRKR